jgi:hypothetical protein
MKFSEGLAVAEINGKCSFIDHKGKLVIHTQYDPLTLFSSFSEGMAKFMSGEKCGYIDRTGRTAIAPRFDDATDFSLPDRTFRLQLH